MKLVVIFAGCWLLLTTLMTTALPVVLPTPLTSCDEHILHPKPIFGIWHVCSSLDTSSSSFKVSLVFFLKCTLIFPGHTFAASRTMSDVLELIKVVGFRKLSHANTNLIKNKDHFKVQSCKQRTNTKFYTSIDIISLL